jgi:heme-degrading monooxygenase HmoA
MHAVVTTVTVGDVDAALDELRENVVPGVSQAPGFVAGYWTRSGNNGLSMTLWESEAAAEEASERIKSTLPDGVTLENVEVREVVAHA